MTIQYHKLLSGDITDAASYQGQLYRVMCQLECTGGDPDTAIYDDGKVDPNLQHAHNPTIGVGFNLRAQLLPVMQAYFGSANPNFGDPTSSPTSPQDKDLMDKLVAVMKESWDGQVDARTNEVIDAINAYYVAITAKDKTAPSIDEFFMTDEQIRTAFTTISLKIEGLVTGYFNAPPSKERLALMSLEWNSPGNPKDGKNLLGNGLYKSLHSDNRASAWFEIRYNSNNGSSLNTGIAKRRYFESQLFGLFNEDTGTAIPQDEALQTYAMMSESTHGKSNRAIIFDYENKYSSEVSNANRDYHGVLGVDVQLLDTALRPAAATLLQHYITDAALNPFAYFYAHNTIDSLDVQVAASAGGSDLLASQRDGYQLAMGGFRNSVLIAQDGADTLDGSGNANDALIGGTGDDTFIVGDGDDYIVAGTGNALIGGPLSAEGIGGIGSGNDTIVLGDPLHARSNGVDTVWGGTGTDVYYLAPGNRDVIHLGLGQTLINVVNDDGSVTPLDLYATALAGAAGTFFDPNKHALVLQSQNADGSSSVKIYDLPGAPSVPEASPHSLSVYGLSTDGHATPPSGADGFLELDNFVGVSEAGVTLDPGATTIAGASNLGDFGRPEVKGDYTVYFDYSGTGGGPSRRRKTCVNERTLSWRGRRGRSKRWKPSSRISCHGSMPTSRRKDAAEQAPPPTARMAPDPG